MASTSEQGEDETWDLKFRQDEEMEFFTELALHEAERWISAVTRKKFSHPEDFRKSLENGVILCELLNTIKPGSVKRINKLPTPIAGLDNINVFLNACKKFFHLRDGHLFDPSDLEDLTQRAIADSATELKIESDRRALNVAICIFWLGKSVSTSYSGPQLDQSAFNALVHHHGKDLIPGGHTRQDSVESNGHSSAYGSHDSCSKSESNDVVDNKHLRNNSYDSYGSYSRESEGSFTLEEENDMPAGSRSNMRRYGSAGSLNTSAGMRFSATGSVDVDDMYQSNPDLVNNHHRRGSSTDSMDSSAYNHSRQSSEDIGIPTRTTRAQRKTSTASVDPLQFVKSKPSDALAKQAKEQIKAAQEVKSVRTKIEKEDEDWQSNLSSWKTKRRRASSAAYQRVEETDNLAQEEEEKKKPKTYSQMMEAREKRKSTGMLNFYPLGDEEDSLTWTPKTNTRDEEPVEETFSKSQTRRTESGPSSRLVERFKRSDIARTASDSHSKVSSADDQDSASYSSKPVSKNRSDVDVKDISKSDLDTKTTASPSLVSSTPNRQRSGSSLSGSSISGSSSSGGDSYVRYDDQNVADWAKGEGDDEDASKQKTESLSRESSNVRKSEDIVPKSRTLDDRFNRGKTSDITKRYSEVTPPSFRDSNKERTPENIGSTGKSTSKISNILRNFETKNEDASQAKPKKAFEFSVETGRKREKWQNLEKQEINKGISKPVLNSKPVGKLADQHFSKVKHDSLETKPGTTEIKSFVEKNIKINQKANNAKGFGFTIEGGVDKKQPVTVHRVNIDDKDSSDLGSLGENTTEKNTTDLPQEDEVSSMRTNGENTEAVLEDISHRLVENEIISAEIEIQNETSFVPGNNYDEKSEMVQKTNEYGTADFPEIAQNNGNINIDSDASNYDDVFPRDNVTLHAGFSPLRSENVQNDKAEFIEPVKSSENFKVPSESKLEILTSPENEMDSPEIIDIIGSSAADVCEVKMKDQIIAINKKDIGHMTQPMVQHMIDNSVKIGQIELKIKRPISEEDDLEDEAFESESPPILPHLKTDHNYSPTNYSSTANQTSVTSHYRNSPVTKKEELPSHHLNEEKKTSPPVPAKRGSQKGRIREDPEEQKKWILEHLKSASAEEADKEEPNNNDLKQEESSESESESDVDEPPPVISPPKQEIVIRPQIEVPKRQEVQRQPENEITETRPTISVRRSPAPEPIPVTEQFTPQLTKKTESMMSPEPQEAPPPPPSAAPPPLKYSNLDVDGFKPPDILKRWQRGSRGTRSDYSSSPTSMDSDGEKRLSSSSFSWQNEFNNTGGSQTSPGSTMSYEKDYPDPHMEPQVGQPITLHLETAPGQLIIDPRNQGDYEEPGLPQYNFHVDFSKQNNKEDDIGQRQVEKYEDEEAVRLREREERIRQQEEELQLQKEQLRQEQERMKQEKEQMERFKTLDLEETAPSQRNGHYKPTEDMASQYKPTESVTQFSVNSDATRAQPRKLEEVWNPNNPLNKEKQRWSREDMLAMNRKATPLQTKPENEALENDSTKHGVSREPLSRSDIHNLNGAPRPKYKSDSLTSSHRDNKFGDPQMRRRSEYTDPNSHWLVEEAERRREKTSKRHSVHTPYQGPIKPVQDNTTNRWRDDSSVTHQQTFSSSNSGVSPRPVNTQQFSANPRSNLSQTLPPNYNFNSGQKREPVVPPKPMRQMPVSPTSPPSHAEQIMAVSGKQLCSHCSQELGFGAAMVIELLGLYYHVQCFRCCVCHTTLGNGSQGADVRVRVNKLHCRNCYSNDEGMTYLGRF
ncbi:hypothetical protein FSP39_016295 [Pinctada imbricata]|uniref:Uncharacterized protein n=1 Tax=Pinctada imbricata TaxID=66713 RepID=A0AA89C8Z6_PINIB|nr:hypothetical protein FSP39_016295 [Pinctada imbricata]